MFLCWGTRTEEALPEYQSPAQGNEPESYPLLQIQHHHPIFPEANHRNTRWDHNTKQKSDIKICFLKANLVQNIVDFELIWIIGSKTLQFFLK